MPQNFNLNNNLHDFIVERMHVNRHQAGTIILKRIQNSLAFILI